MNKFTIIVLLSCYFVPNILISQNIELGSKIDTLESDSYIILPNNCLTKHITLKENGIKYNLGLSNDNTIVFISTNDSTFSINDIKIGDCISSFCDINKIDFRIDNKNFTPGWGYYIPINNEWFVALDFKEKPDKNSKVQFFFKYSFDCNFENNLTTVE